MKINTVRNNKRNNNNYIKNKILASVVMPVYNGEKFLSRSIPSILNQTYKHFEFIIIDDGSTDNTAAILKKYQKQDSRIKIVTLNKNRGACIAFNIGVKTSQGKYIFRMDADDESITTRFDEQIQLMEKHPEIGVCGTNSIEYMNGKKIGIKKYPSQDHILRTMIYRCSPFCNPSTIIRKEIFQDCQTCDHKYAIIEDLELWFRIPRRWKFTNINKPLLKYYQHETSTTSQRTKSIAILSIKLRLENKRNKNFTLTPSDHILLYVSKILIMILPGKVLIQLFNIMRKQIY